MSDPTKEKIIHDFKIIKTIAEGSYGKVKLGQHIITGEKVAIKIVSYKNMQKKKELHQLRREIKILTQLDHPNIVKLHHVINDKVNEKCYMIFDYVPGGELYEYIVKHGRLSEDSARKFIRQMVSALEYCHSFLIIHRDLKPENLLLDEELNIKISDFGLSNIIKPGKRFSTFCGSLHYASPEILLGKKYLGPGIDVWSLGIILYCLVVGHQPWDGSSAVEVLRAMKEEGLSIPEDISDDCVDLILKMLKLKEENRISVSQIIEHPWIAKGYNGPPPSYLPEPYEIEEIDPLTLKQLKLIGFKEAEYPETINDILCQKKTLLVATYHLLQEKKKKELSKKKTDRSLSRFEKSDILFSFTSSDSNITDKIDSGDRRRSSTIAGQRPEFVKHMTDRTPDKKSTKTGGSKPKSARKMSNNRINSRSPKKREKSRTKSKSPQNYKNGHLLDKLDEVNELNEQTREEDNQAMLEILKQYGIDDIDMVMKTSKVNNARPILDLEKLEQEEKAKFLSAGRRNNNNRSPSPHTRKSVINYFDDANERTHLKSFQVGDFTSSTTSSMPIRYIQKEIRRVLKKFAIEYHIKDYIYNCKSKIKEEVIEYVIEIVNITDFEHLKGLVFKKVEGSDGIFDQHHKLILDNVNI